VHFLDDNASLRLADPRPPCQICMVNFRTDTRYCSHEILQRESSCWWRLIILSHQYNDQRGDKGDGTIVLVFEHKPSQPWCKCTRDACWWTKHKFL